MRKRWLFHVISRCLWLGTESPVEPDLVVSGRIEGELIVVRTDYVKNRTCSVSGVKIRAECRGGERIIGV